MSVHNHENVALFDLVNLTGLMADTSGCDAVSIALVDGPIASSHPALVTSEIVTAARSSTPAKPGVALNHGTFVAGLLAAERGCTTPGIAPACTLVSFPVFRPNADGNPTASVSDVADAILQAVRIGVQLINISAVLAEAPLSRLPLLQEALNCACRAGILVIAPAGPRSPRGTSLLAQHDAVVPVAGCTSSGSLSSISSVSLVAGARGILAPAENLVSLAPDGGHTLMSGTSAAAALVTGTCALLWSLFPSARSQVVRRALTHSIHRRTVVPALLDAERARRRLAERSRSNNVYAQ